MNGFFPKWRIIVFSVFCFLLTGTILIRYASLSAKEPERIAQKPPAVERGSIVDRNGKPLAVDTNFFHLESTPTKSKTRKISLATSLRFWKWTKTKFLA